MAYDKEVFPQEFRPRELRWSAIAPHLGHCNHLCHWVECGADIEEYRKLVKEPKFLCKKCGRVAEAEKNLCEPISL